VNHREETFVLIAWLDGRRRDARPEEPPAAAVFNEDVSNPITGKIKTTDTHLDELDAAIDDSREVTAEDAQQVLDTTGLHTRADFRPHLGRIVDDVISVIERLVAPWPTLVEISYFRQGRHGLPQTRVRSHAQRGGL
jgi:hypothetical protein